MNSYNPAAGQAPTSNNAAVAALVGPTDGTGWVVNQIVGSYSGVPTNPTLTIVYGGGTGGGSYTETIYLAPNAGGFTITYQIPRWYPKGAYVNITLSAGGSGISCSLYVYGQTQY